jgi:hypothetical protein
VVFSWWDRLHRTLGLDVPQSAIRIGVPALGAPEHDGLLNALWLPFRRQPDYWQGSDGALLRRERDVPRTPGRMAE